MDKIALGKRLRALRRKHRMSHGDLRRATYMKSPAVLEGERGAIEGVWESHQSAIENGRMMPTLNTLEKIAAGLGIPFWRLLLELFCEDTKERKQAIKEVTERTQSNDMENNPQNQPETA